MYIIILYNYNYIKHSENSGLYDGWLFSYVYSMRRQMRILWADDHLMQTEKRDNLTVISE